MRKNTETGMQNAEVKLQRALRREEMEWLRKKNSDVKSQKTLSSLKILYHSFLSVLSVVKNSCSVILNSFQNLVSRKARKGSKGRQGAKKNFKTTFSSQNSPPFKGGRGDVADCKSSSLNEGGRLFFREATPPFIPPKWGTHGGGTPSRTTGLPLVAGGTKPETRNAELLSPLYQEGMSRRDRGVFISNTKLGMRDAEVRNEKGNVISGKYQHAVILYRKNIAGQNLLIKRRALCYLYISALSVLSVVKNSCSAILNSFQESRFPRSARRILDTGYRMPDTGKVAPLPRRRGFLRSQKKGIGCRV